MFRKLTAAALTIVLAAIAAPEAALAQSTQRNTSRDAELPVSLDRIRRELAQQTRTSESKDGLRLTYYVEVYGTAPPIQLFTPEENLTSSPVRYGGMTHQEFLNVVTPQEFRAPAADISSAIAALMKWAAEKKKNGEAKR